MKNNAKKTHDKIKILMLKKNRTENVIVSGCKKETVDKYLNYVRKLEEAGVDVHPRYTLSNINDIPPKQFLYSDKRSMAGNK